MRRSRPVLPRLFRMAERRRGRSLFERVMDMVAEDAKGGAVEILARKKRCAIVLVHDGPNDIEIELHDPAFIGRAFLGERLVVFRSVSECRFAVDRECVLDFLELVDKRMFMTLKKIVIVRDPGEEERWIPPLAPFAPSLGFCQPGDGAIAVFLGEIEDRAKGKSERAFHREVAVEFAATLLHEIRHLAQANPWLSISSFGRGANLERDAERYAVRFIKNMLADRSFDGRRSCSVSF